MAPYPPMLIYCLRTSSASLSFFSLSLSDLYRSLSRLMPDSASSPFLDSDHAIMKYSSSVNDFAALQL